MAEKIKVLQVVPVLGCGGVEKVVINYYRNMDHREFLFDFFSHGEPDKYALELLGNDCKVYKLETIGKLGYNRYKKKIQSIIDVSTYDIVHIHTGHLLGLYAKVFSELGAKKIICHAHTTKCVNKMHKLLMPFFRQMLKRYSNHNLACGETAGNYCFGKQKYELLPNGIEYTRFKNISDEKIYELKKELGIEDTQYIIGHIGYFSKPKNHLYIVKIIEKYHLIYPKGIFVLVGDGPDKSTIEAEIKDKSLNKFVIFTGVRQDVPVLMKMFDLFILPSLHEGLPVVSIEAQASGTECLLSDRIDSSLDVGLGLTHFLPLDDDCGEWIKMIEHVRKQGKKPIDDMRIHRALLGSGYDVATSAKKLEQIYKSVVVGDENNEA